MAPVAEIVPGDGEPASEGYSRPPGNDVPLKALPVEPLESDGGDQEDEYRGEEFAPAPRPIRAIPVETDEVIEDGVEEP